MAIDATGLDFLLRRLTNYQEFAAILASSSSSTVQMAELN
jgi:hypothetical protein